ncbi:hypothetical protein C8F01DRAFT_1147221 [Mycena amicta]|nr:hypothetical protein C8F01DRAFT_1147221 [Mycena amicta]
MADNGADGALTRRDDSSIATVGAYFPNARNFTVSGGTFTSTVVNPPNDGLLLGAFRRIPRGDIYLQGLRASAAVRNTGTTRPHRARTMYSAHVYGSAGTMLVALYDGDENSNEEWTTGVLSLHLNLHHPNIMQLFGVVNSPAGTALVYHGGFLSFDQILDDSPLTDVFLRDAALNLYDHLASWLGYHCGGEMGIHMCTFWFRPSTATLCIELEQSPFGYVLSNGWVMSVVGKHLPPPPFPTVALEWNSAELNTVTLTDFHQRCDRWKRGELRMGTFATLGSVVKSTGPDIWWHSGAFNQGEEFHPLPVAVSKGYSFLEAWEQVERESDVQLSANPWTYTGGDLEHWKARSEPRFPIKGDLLANGWTRSVWHAGRVNSFVTSWQHSFRIFTAPLHISENISECK